MADKYFQSQVFRTNIKKILTNLKLKKILSRYII